LSFGPETAKAPLSADSDSRIFAMVRSLVSLALALAFYTVPATAGDWENCVSDGRDSSIKGCTAFLAHEGETAPNRARAYANRGIAYHQAKGELDRAIADYNRAIELDPKLAFAYGGRADAYRDRGELDRAVADYNRAIELDPDYADAYNGRGVAFEAKGDMDKAIAYYNRALELDPKFVRAYNGRGNAYRAKGELNSAIADYNRAIDLDPNYVYAYSNRAAISEASGDLAKARADRRRAAELNSKDAESPRRVRIAKVDDGGFKIVSAYLLRVAVKKANAPTESSDSAVRCAEAKTQPREQMLQAAVGHNYSRHLRRRLSHRINARRGSRLAHRHHRYKQARVSRHNSGAGQASMENNFFPL